MDKETLLLAGLFLFLSGSLLLPWPRPGRWIALFRILLASGFLLLASLLGLGMAEAAAQGQSVFDALIAWLAQGQLQLQSLPPLLEPFGRWLAVGLQGFSGALLSLKALPPLKATFLLGLMLLGGYSLIRFVLLLPLYLLSWLLALLARLWRWFRALIGYPSPAKQPLADGLWLAKNRHFLIPGLFAALASLSLPLAFIPYWSQSPPLAGYYSLLFWIGAWIFSLEVWSLLRAKGQPAGDGLQVSTEPSDAESLLRLEGLFEAYQSRFGDGLLRKIPIPSQVGAAQTPAERPGEAAALLSEIEALFPRELAERMLGPVGDHRQGKDLLFVETLTQTHLLLFSKLIMDSLSREGSVLVLCPEGYAEEVQCAFERIFDDRFIKMGYRVHREEDIRDPGLESDLFIYTPEGLERFLSGRQAQGLSLLLALGCESMDLALLRHELGRLWLKADPSRVRKLFQAQSLYNAEPTLRAITRLRGLVEHQLNPQRQKDRFLLIWDADRSSRLLREAYGLGQRIYASPPPLLAYLANEPEYGFRTIWVDGEQGADRDLLERLKKYDSLPVPACDLAEEFQLSPQDSPVLVLEDPHNLAHALSRHHRGGHDSSLIHIVCGDYLLRGLMLKEPEERVRELLLPVLPAVTGSLVDLARQVARALDTPDGISQEELRQMLDLFPEQRLLTERDIQPSSRGVKHLLAEALGIDNAFVRCQQDPAGTYYRVGGILSAGPQRLEVREDGGNVLGHWWRNDYGLIYYEGVTLLLKGKHYEVNKADSDGGLVSVRHIDDETLAPHRFLFDRDYHIDRQWLPGDSQRRSEDRPRIHIDIETLSLDIRRVTHGYYKLAQYRATPETSLYQACHPQPVCPRRWCNALRIRFSGEILASIQDPAKTAFTLAALLQEVLYSLFPFQERRLAVLPEERPPFDPADLRAFNTEAMPHYLYPRLAQPAGAQEGKEGAGQERAGIGLYLLEDADADLGVARTIAGQYERYFQLVLEYLSHRDDKENANPWRYHHFGSDKLPACFDYAGVHLLLDPLFVGVPLGADPPTAGPTDSTTRAAAAESGLCDFCGDPLSARHDRLADGRQRCQACSRDAIEGGDIDEVRQEIQRIVDNMESRYHISLPRDFQARIVSAETLAQRLNQRFIPTQGFDQRAVGLAVMENERMEILIENGAPRTQFKLTTAHELTHIWQFRNANNPTSMGDKDLIEGQASFIEVDYGLSQGLDDRLSRRLADSLRSRNDEYGRGFRRIEAECAGTPASALFQKFLQQLA